MNFTESFTGASAPGWIFEGNYTPWLTAGANPNAGAGFIDSPGNGWLRLTDNGANRATSALLDTQIFSVNARIEITMDYAFWNGTGADGITFFLVDGGVNASTFTPGAYGGSMGYAQRSGIPGMPGGYLGFALDNFGNYSNGSEGRNGGITNNGTLYPNRVAVRGPESSDYAFIAASGVLPGQMDFPGYTTRPDQTGADYRSFKIVFDANNQLTVSMKFGATADYVSVFNADLSAYERPETFKVGFTGATGGSNEIHEIRQLSVSMTPWSVADGGNEWDRGAGTTTWGATAGADNNNWFGNDTGDNKTPLAVGANSGTYPGADILFGNKPTQVGTTGGPRGGPAQFGDTETVDLGSTSTSIRSLTFDTGLNYVLDGTGTLTLGNGTGSSPQNAGIASINVNDYNEAYGLHKINTALALDDALAIRNFSFSTLCINDAIETNGRTMTVSGQGAVNFNGDISGSGALIKNGRGITTINNNNSDDPDAGGPLTAWTGAVTVNDGMLVVTSNGALGSTAAGTTVNSGGTLAFRGGVNYSTAETVTISGDGIFRSTSQLAGAIHNDGGNNSFAGAVVLAGNASLGSREGVLTLSGLVSESGGVRTLTKVGAGVVDLSNGANTWTGETIISGGALRISGGVDSLAGGFSTNDTVSDFGTLTFNGGVLDINIGSTFSRSVGTGEEQVRWTGDGGFAASGGNRTVSLTGGNVTWDSGSFVPTGNALVLGHQNSTHTLDFQNGINLGAAQREIRVVDGASNTTGAIDGRLSGVLSGTGGIDKTGSGTLELGANNTYTGETRISGGALRVGATDRINGSDLILNGGVLEIAGDLSASTGEFTRSVGTSGGDDVRWTADGGFAAVGGARTVRLNDGTGNVTWGVDSGFIAADSRLLLGSASANNTVTFANGLVLGASGTRTIQTTLGTNSTLASGVLSGVVSGSANLSITGNGRLDLTAANTNNGTVSIIGSELRLSGASGTLNSVTNAGSDAGFTISQGGRLVFDNGSNSVERIGNTTNVALNGGRIDFIGRTNNNAATETMGDLVLLGGENQVNVQRTGGRAAILAVDTITRTAGSGSTLEFTNESGGGTLGTTGNNPRVTVSSAPTLEQGILAWSVFGNGATPTTFSTVTSGVITGASLNTTVGASSWNSSLIVSPSSNQTLSANQTVGALALGSGISVGGNATLTIDTGGLLSTGAANSTLSVSNLQVGGSGSRELFTHVYGNGTLTISSAIQNNSNTLGLVKSGNGTLVLSGTTANTFSGPSFFNDGTLVLNKTAGLNAIAGNLTVGDGRGVDTLRLGANEQIANDASVVLRGGQVGNSANVARFELNGALTVSDSPRIETFHSLQITGNSILDFGGGTVCSPSFLYLDVLSVTAGSLLTITNWVEFTDFLLVEANGVTPADLSNIVFEGYSGAASWQFYGDANGKTYWQVTPVPEPATYGLLSIGGLLGFLRLRRRRRAPAGPAQAAV